MKMVIALGGRKNKAQIGDMGIDGRIYPVGVQPHKFPAPSARHLCRTTNQNNFQPRRGGILRSDGALNLLTDGFYKYASPTGFECGSRPLSPNPLPKQKENFPPSH